MSNNPDAVVIIGLALIFLIMLFRPILRLIDRKYPKQIRRFYEFWQAPQIDAEHECREKAQEDKGRKDNERKKSGS